MKSHGMIICEASEMAGQLTALMELLFERGTGNGLPANDPVIGLTYNMAAKIEAFLRNEEERQDKQK